MSSRTRFYNRYRPYRSSIASRTRNQQRAADQQRDSTTVVINTNMSFDCGQTMNEIYMNKGDDGWFDTGCMAINIYDILRNSDFYNSYSNLYDQVKIDNVRAKIIATNWATSQGAGDTEKINEIIKAKSYVIVTAWDRSGISRNQIVFDEKWNDAVENKKFYLKIGKDIASYSSAKTKHLGPGNAYEIVRQLYPQNEIERWQYVNTSMIKKQQTRVNTEYFPYNCFYKKVVDLSENPNGYVYEAYDFNSKYPSNLISDPAVPFKPTLLVNVISGPSPYVTNVKQKDPEGFYTLLTIGVNKIKPVTFDVEFDITCTFRGLRYDKNLIKENIDNYVKNLYPLDNSGVIKNDFKIIEIQLNESKFNNNKILNAQYSFGGQISKPNLPYNEGNYYVVYLKDELVDGDEFKPPYTKVKKIYIINYGTSAYTRRFANNELFLFDFVADKYAEGGIIDYVNLLMKAPSENKDVNNPDIVYKKSVKINVPITIDDNRHSTTGILLTDIPPGYQFVWENDVPNDDGIEDMDDDNE